MKNIAILGSTGSIGTQTLEVVDITKEYQIETLSAHSNVELMEKQIRKYKPKKVVFITSRICLFICTNVKMNPRIIR